MKCKCKQFTLKVPMGNAFKVVFPIDTAEWEHDEQEVEVVETQALTDIVIKVDGEVWEHGWEMEERGPLVNFPKDSLSKGPHNVEITALYFGVDIRAAYFECITMVQWSYESNVGDYIDGSPLVAEAAYIYVGITDDDELEELKQQLRTAIAEKEAARLAYEAAKEEFDEKAEALDDVATETNATANKNAIIEAVNNAQPDLSSVAKQTTLVDGIASVLQGFAPLATTQQLNTVAQNILTAISHIDIDTTTLAKEQTLTNGIQSILTALNPKATTADVTAAKEAILTAIGNINVEGVDWLLQFFDITGAFTANEVSEQEAIDVQQEVLDDVWPDCPVGSGGSAAWAARRNWADDTEADVRYYNSTIGLQCSPIPVNGPVVYNGYRFYPDGTYESIE